MTNRVHTDAGDQQKAERLADALDVLEMGRIAETIQLRAELIKAAKELLPVALQMSKGNGPPCEKCGRPTGKSSPALLRLIARLAMRDASIDNKKPPRR